MPTSTVLLLLFSLHSSMEQARDDLANELASGTPNYAQAVAGATRYCPLIAHVLKSLEQAVRSEVCSIAALRCVRIPSNLHDRMT